MQMRNYLKLTFGEIWEKSSDTNRQKQSNRLRNVYFLCVRVVCVCVHVKGATNKQHCPKSLNSPCIIKYVIACN